MYTWFYFVLLMNFFHTNNLFNHAHIYFVFMYAHSNKKTLCRDLYMSLTIKIYLLSNKFLIQ